MIRVGRAIPKLLSNAEIDRIRHEVMMYAAETIDQSWYIKNKYHDSDGNNHTEYQQIDYYQEQLSLHALKKVGIIDAQAVNALIGAGDEQVKLISDELFKITDELLKLQ
ncbi:unnamed protein product, partial [Rotaria sordida]